MQIQYRENKLLPLCRHSLGEFRPCRGMNDAIDPYPLQTLNVIFRAPKHQRRADFEGHCSPNSGNAMDRLILV